MRRALGLLLLIACKPKSPAPLPDASPPAVSIATVDAAPPPPEPRPIGPFETPFEGTRNVYYVVPPLKNGKARLLANLHGICNPPGYACGYWVNAASTFGFLVCPEGNGRCGGSTGPTTWSEPVPKIDEDLEKAITKVDATYPNEIDREGAVLTGFSLGATSAYHIARAHPGRWPYLVLVEADVALDKSILEQAGVKAVAMLAGELGSQVAGQKKTVARLAAQGFPAKLWVMKKAGHFYSADIDDLMKEAITFVIAEGK